MAEFNTAAHPLLYIHIRGRETVTVELYPELAPNAVNSILELIDQNGFEELVIQRIAPDFVLQPWYDETRMDERYHYVMEKEISPDFRFTRYAVGIAGNEEIASCGCFYFVMGDDCETRLNGKFTGVGRVTEGAGELERIMHVKLQDVPCDIEGVVVKEPVVPEIVEQITYELNGYERQSVEKWLEVF